MLKNAFTPRKEAPEARKKSRLASAQTTGRLCLASIATLPLIVLTVGYSDASSQKGRFPSATRSLPSKQKPVNAQGQLQRDRIRLAGGFSEPEPSPTPQATSGTPTPTPLSWPTFAGGNGTVRATPNGNAVIGYNDPNTGYGVQFSHPIAGPGRWRYSFNANNGTDGLSATVSGSTSGGQRPTFTLHIPLSDLFFADESGNVPPGHSANLDLTFPPEGRPTFSLAAQAGLWGGELERDEDPNYGDQWRLTFSYSFWGF